jgi:hypothetical protein
MQQENTVRSPGIFVIPSCPERKHTESLFPQKRLDTGRHIRNSEKARHFIVPFA